MLSAFYNVIFYRPGNRCPRCVCRIFGFVRMAIIARNFYKSSNFFRCFFYRNKINIFIYGQIGFIYGYELNEHQRHCQKKQYFNKRFQNYLGKFPVLLLSCSNCTSRIFPLSVFFAGATFGAAILLKSSTRVSLRSQSSLDSQSGRITAIL